METQITNKVTLSYNSGYTVQEASSNVASVTLHGANEVQKK